MSTPVRRRTLCELLPPAAFAREDDGDDAEFYGQPRLINHLDRRALETVGRIIDSLVIEARPDVLDLMASWDSHWPARRPTGRFVGLGLNAEELERNRALSERVIHDLNRADAVLPFDDASFDVVLNVVSVDYLVRPVEVFREVGRVLRPGGLFLVIFSDRMFSTKAVRIWRESGDAERVWLVEDYFADAACFGKTSLVVSHAKVRPADDRHAGLGLSSDPVFAVYAERTGASRGNRPQPDIVDVQETDPALVAARLRTMHQTLTCPHCAAPLAPLEIPVTPFVEWDLASAYVCMNDQCPYIQASWQTMAGQGNPGLGYRLMYDPLRRACHPLPYSSASVRIQKMPIAQAPSARDVDGQAAIE